MTDCKIVLMLQNSDGLLVLKMNIPLKVSQLKRHDGKH